LNVPVELVIWIGGGNILFLSFCAHLLIRIWSRVTEMDKRQWTIEYELKMRPSRVTES
jgi:hypothetical protein